MNLVLLLPEDLMAPDRARLSGRRLAHVREVHRAAVGDELAVGLLGGKLGRGRVLRLDDEALELALTLDQAPPPKLPLTLLVAVPRPKVLNRVVAAAASLGAARIVLLNAWKVEKAYWASPKMKPENLREQLLLGLEQAKDTVLPELRLARLYLDPPEHAVVLSVDEKSQIQALDRTQPGLPLKKGRCGTMTAELPA